MKKTMTILGLFIASLSNAAIIHTEVNEIAEFGDDWSGAATVTLDIDGTIFECVYNSDFGGIRVLDPDYDFDTPNVLTNSTPDIYTDEIKIFSAGELIDDSYFVNVDGQTQPIWLPGTEPAGEYFFGFKTNSGKYGWIHIDVEPGVKYEVLAYAIEDNTGDAIEAGDTGSGGGGDASLEENSVLSLSFYPNPVNHTIFINDLNADEIESVNIFAISGDLVISSLNGNGSINVSDIKSGFYIIRVQATNGLIYNARFNKI